MSPSYRDILLKQKYPRESGQLKASVTMWRSFFLCRSLEMKLNSFNMLRSFGDRWAYRSYEPGNHFLTYQFLFHPHMWILLSDVSHHLVFWHNYPQSIRSNIGWVVTRKQKSDNRQFSCLYEAAGHPVLKKVGLRPDSPCFLGMCWSGMIQEKEVMTGLNRHFTPVEVLTPVTFFFWKPLNGSGSKDVCFLQQTSFAPSSHFFKPRFNSGHPVLCL